LADSHAQPNKTHASSLIEARLRKSQELADLGIASYSAGFVPNISAARFKEEFDDVLTP